LLVMKVRRITLGENGGTITLIARCSAEGSLVTSYCIVKGKKKNNKFKEGMTPGLRVTMNETCAYVTTIVFMDWLRSHFIPRKESGSFLLKLDGHRSHCSEVNVLEFATENDVILLCLPSHRMHHLQPLNRFFLKPLKTFWQQAVNNWTHSNTGRSYTSFRTFALF
jgi:hypothetical protein